VEDPILRFLSARERARETEPLDATAASLATADVSGQPSARMVLVKIVDEAGFHLFTNYESRKARELDANPRGALCFHWPTRGEQVRVEGRVRRSTVEESDRYFATRPKPSQIGACVSKQSAELGSRAELEASVRECEARFAEGAVARPEYWGGYVVVPEVIEFWSEGENRLHDREEYRRSAGQAWVVRRLWP
jgi:pyridoxamine 5'-phosphate oxidase